MAKTTLPVLTCDDCGACCLEQAGLPITYYSVLEPDAPLTPALRAEIDDTARRWNGLGIWAGPGDGVPCVWYDPQTKGCRHYEHRPSICREFDVGSPECLEWRRDKGVTAG